ncbi:MAG: hypothetical protein H0T42_24490 [Deltaproteobacteria bacterium]|nr:hypothetical protein [Deltaproteobacteria bacterium]
MRILLGSLAFLAACGPAGRENDTVDAPGSQVDSPATPAVSRVYGHSGDRLYRLDPTTLAPTEIGAMAGLDTGLLDLAVDKDDRLVGITRLKLYSISATTGAATLIRDLSASAQNFTSLSYVPGATMNDPDILISANDQGNVYKIDETTGSATLLGNYGMHNSMQVVSSGDIFGVRGFGVFATVNVGSGMTDYLARIDTTTWKATPLATATGYDKIFGLGFWGGKIYGFVDDGFDADTGKLIEINSTSGAATMLNTSGVRWFGAGVTTSAPILL